MYSFAVLILGSTMPLGVAKSSVSQWCSNIVQPILSKLYEIAGAIGCDIRDLINPTKLGDIGNKST
jgi:transcriptional regulator with XRE-family HTH domain